MTPTSGPTAQSACKGSAAETRGVRVVVHPEYVPEQSDPDSRQFLFTYRIRISNTSDTTVQLRERHWIIVDAHGERDEVRGPGVVGQQPRLEPGQSFEYSSFVQFRTPWGTMEGEYTMVTPAAGAAPAEAFQARVARFFLVAPVEPGARR
jgi:ApaG protein